MTTPGTWPEFVHRRRVQFADTDAAGIVHFTTYFRYVEEAEHAMWRAAGLSISTPGANYSFPRISASMEYHAPLRFEEEIDVRIRIVEAGSRTVRYDAVIWRGTTRIGTGRMMMACVTTGKDGALEAVPFPEHIRQALGLPSAGSDSGGSKPGSPS